MTKKLIALIFYFCIHSALAQSVPPLINYQGMLTDSEGKPLVGTKNLTFNIYASADATDLIWGPQVFTTVPLINGQFNVILGTTDTVGRSLVTAFGESNRFLGIKVGDETEITPRQQVLSSPYAIKAGHHSNIIPVGSINAYWGGNAPLGWLMCDGASIPDEAIYEELKKLVGNNTPDLRGMFLRGLNDGRMDGRQDPNGSSRLLGSYQEDKFSLHSHSYVKRTGIDGHQAGPYHNIAHGLETKDTDSVGGDETRPKNIAVRFIIKY
ncbi:MAG: tail fiber protein [Methyloprofundus sp.]|nr:tail fiber protein [Methyloprofundus sp.]